MATHLHSEPRFLGMPVCDLIPVHAHEFNVPIRVASFDPANVPNLRDDDSEIAFVCACGEVLERTMF